MKAIRESIAKMQGYIPGRQPSGVYVKLNANENPYPPSPKVAEALASLACDNLRLYPSSSSAPLRKIASETFGIKPESIVCGNGSDDVFTMIIRTFLNAGDTLAVVDPTYTLYETLAQIQDAKTERHPLKEDYSLPESFFESKAKLKILPNPNAQTGTLFPEKDLRRLCETAQGAVVLDEAYALFSGKTSLGLLSEFPNLVVTRTLSKSHSLAGMRIGFGFASEEIIEAFHKVRDSYNVNTVSQAVGAAALLDGTYTEKVVGKILKTKKTFAAGLVALGWEVIPSEGNFLLVKPPSGEAKEIVKRLEKEGFLVRHFETLRLQDKIRISIGTDEQMEQLLALIANLTKEAAC